MGGFQTSERLAIRNDDLLERWLTVDFVVGVLLATSFAAAGLVALWAATSEIHWFVRLAAVAALLLPLLAIPAYEPLLVFTFQSVAIAGVVAFQRWKPWRRESWNRQLVTVSLGNGLLFIAVVALLVAVGARIPDGALYDWDQLLVAATAFSVVALIVAQLVFGRGTLRRRVLLAIFALTAVSIFVASLNDWPNQFTETLTLEDFQNWTLFVTPPFLTGLWLGIVPAAATMMAIVLLLERKFQQADGGRRAAYAVSVACTMALVLLFPAIVVWKLAHPSPIPVIEMPSPNGYDDLVRGGAMIQAGSPMLNTAVEPKSTQDLAAEIAKYSTAYDAIRLGLARPSKVEAFPANGNLERVLDTDNMSHLRSAARALMREAELAQQQDRFGDAAAISVENIRLGHAVTRSGLMIDAIVGIAIEGLGHSTLVQIVGRMDQEACGKTIAALESAEQTRESFADICRRDRIWSEHAYGWGGHLMIIVDDFSCGTRSNDDILVDSVFPRVEAVTNLLILELALRQYRLDHGKLPPQLEELVPAYLKRLPVDPFDKLRRPLRYSLNKADMLSNDGYVLYSLGFDRDDDGGVPLELDEYGGYNFNARGDLRLDAMFTDEWKKAGESTVSDEDAT